MWFRNLRALLRRFRVIAYDMRGHGETDAPQLAAEYSAAHHARDLVGVLDALAIKQAAIVGFSLGGGPAWRWPPASRSACRGWCSPMSAPAPTTR